MVDDALVLSLDLSTRTGWALGREGENPVHGVWVLPRMSEIGATMSALAGQLEDAIRVFRPDVCIFEAPLPPQAQTATNTARLLIGAAAVVDMICFEQKVPCEEEAAPIARRRVMGNGRPSKLDVIAWCRSQKWTPVEDNDADALLLLRYRHLIGRRKVRHV